MEFDDLPPLSTDVVVPDDARELARDVEAYRREQRAVRRRSRFGWLLRRRAGLPSIASIVAIVLVVAAGTALALFGPTYGRHTAPRRTAALAQPSAAVGSVGGLLPDVALGPGGVGQRDGLASVRAARPAVLVVLPATCTCGTTMAQALRTAQSHGIGVYVIASTAGPKLRQLAAPDPAVTAGEALVDTTGALHAAYPTTGEAPTAVVVDETGVVRAIIPGLSSADPLRSALDQLVTVRG